MKLAGGVAGGAALVVSVCLGSCTVPTVETYAAFMQTELKGEFALDSSSGGASLGAIQVDLERDLGIDDASNSVLLGGVVDTDLGRVSVSWFRYDESGTGTLSADFGDIAAGTTVETDVRLDNLKAHWTFDLLDIGPVRLSPGLGVDMFWVETDVRSVAPVSAFEQVDVVAPVPMVFLQGAVDVGVVSGLIEAGAMSIDLDDADGDYWDLEGRLAVRPVDNLQLFAGYRFIHIDADGTADGQRFDAELDLTGWFIGGGVEF